MVRVLQPGGTAWRLSQGLQYTMGGKTGTAQVVQIKQGATYNAGALAEQHRDHAWFISFAPVDKPKIAIAVIIENGGWGATAAPIARQLSDFYLLKLKDQPPMQASGNPNRIAPNTAIPQSASALQAAFGAAAGAN